MKPAPTYSDSEIERFWSLVDKSDGCWLWRGPAGNSFGHGAFCAGEAIHYAHRVSYFLGTGVWPGGWHVLHSCDVPSCVNPEHLRLGTHAENTADRVTRGRTSKGDRHPKAKLTEQQVREIRFLDVLGAKQHELAEQYGVSQPTIHRAIKSKNWRHVP